MTKKISSSGIVYSGPCEFGGYLLGMDGTNDVIGAAVYNGQDNSGDEICPSCPFEADAKGLNGVTNWNRDCPNGLYAEFTVGGGGTAEMVVRYRPMK